MFFFDPSTLAPKLAQFNGDLPLAQARTIPRHWYGDQEIFAAECEAAFKGSWQLVGRTSQLAEIGDALTADIGGEPVLVIRGKDKKLRAMSNTCSHRANVLVKEPATRLSLIMCKYHGWNYTLSGDLQGTPQFDCEGCAYRKEEHGLEQYSVDIWGPYVFVHKNKPHRDLAAHFAPMPTMLAEAFDIGSLEFHERREWVLDCNWKVFVDNYQDGGYHVKTVHPALAGVLDYSKYRTDLFDMTSLQSSPLKSGTLSDVRCGDLAHYWWVFPNLMFNLYRGYMDMNLVIPVAPDRCRVIFDFWFSPELKAEHRAQSIAAAEQVQKEDIEVCQSVQRGLQGTRWKSGPFSVIREPAAYLFHQILARQLRTLVTQS